jgi:hypothetical protein
MLYSSVVLPGFLRNFNVRVLDYETGPRCLQNAIWRLQFCICENVLAFYQVCLKKFKHYLSVFIANMIKYLFVLVCAYFILPTM